MIWNFPDRGGIVSVLHDSGTLIDAIPYGDFYGLSAENPYLYDTLQAGRSLKTVRRESYSGPVFDGGVVADEDVAVGDANPGVEPKPSLKPASGRYELNRGRKVYEMKNHLGNVLAVVSDVKIGVGPAVLPSVVDYYEADVVEMTDYEPFGMPLSRRRWVSGDKYRFGFQGQEGDDEWNGEGNMLAFKYRIHDAQLGRFLSIDPLAPDYPFWSPYAFSGNLVINSVELEGLEPVGMDDANSIAKYQTQAVPDAKGIIYTTANDAIPQRSLGFNLDAAQKGTRWRTLAIKSIMDPIVGIGCKFRGGKHP